MKRKTLFTVLAITGIILLVSNSKAKSVFVPVERSSTNPVPLPENTYQSSFFQQ